MGRRLAKRVTAALATAALPVVDYNNAIFVLSHMRSVSTALTNVLCTHSAISGYGETHVPFTREDSVGQCAVNIMLRGAWKPEGRFVLDKILHNELDAQAPTGFYAARAVFLIRSPAAAITSIARLSETSPELGLADMDAAGIYYRDRLTRLMYHWSRFPPNRRIGLITEDLLADPDIGVRKLGDHLDLVPGLRNAYRSHPASTKGGGGDPTWSGARRKILKSKTAMEQVGPSKMDASLAMVCEDLFATFSAEFSQPAC